MGPPASLKPDSGVIWLHRGKVPLTNVQKLAQEARVGCRETVGVAIALVQVRAMVTDEVGTIRAEGGWKHGERFPGGTKGGRGGDQGGSWGA